MSPHGAPRRERLYWPVIASLLLLLGFVGGLVAVHHWPDSAGPAAPHVISASRMQEPQRPAQAPAQAAPKDVAAAKPTGPVEPSFDIVRVGPQGQAVIAGRAERGAEVTIHDGDRTLGKAVADAQGQFVVLPDAALPPGGRELTLSARNADGKEVGGGNSVFLAIPSPPSPSAPAAKTASESPPSETGPAAVAVLLPHDTSAPRILQGAGRKLALGTVDYDDHGEIRFAGSAKPNASVRLYVDNQPVGDAAAGSGGQWSMTPSNPVAPGMHQLRVDQLDAAGGVSGRVELPFQRAAPSPVKEGRAVVQPGQNLWRIARQSYGRGMRYTVIFLANHEQIRDPNLIYPGQIFTVPPPS
ncbi:MAG: Ig-like domain-containing protein [Acetobacteraceae bacterium]|nr:Ig-like domain-containing protein [Acetobacteraceae bacterium]